MNKKISSESRYLSVFFGLIQIMVVGGLAIWAYICDNFIFTNIGILFLILVVFLFAWSFIKCSVSIELTKNGLLIEYFRKKELVGFNNIHSISGGWVGPFRFPNENTVKIIFKEPTIFGNSIKFIPEIDLDAIGEAWRPLEFEGRRNYVVDKLKTLIENTKP